MKIGQRGFGTRRSTPYGTDPIRLQIMSNYANSVEQFAPFMGVETYENNILPKDSYKVKDESEEKKRTVLDDAKDLGWLVDFSLHPENYATETPGNELFKYEQFLPEFLAKQNVAKNEARRLAELILPKTATQKEVDDLTERIYKRDTDAVNKSISANLPLDPNNIYKKVLEQDAEMEAYRIMTDPYKRAYNLGWFDENGVLQDGVLGIMSKMADEQLKLLAQIKKGYANDAMFIASNPSLDYFNGLHTAYKMINGENPLYTDEQGHSYMLDVFPAFLTGRKEVRILNYQGQIVRGSEFQKMADNVKHIIDMQDRLDDLSVMIEDYLKLYQNGLLTLEQAESQQQLLEERKNILNKIELDSKYIDLLGSYESVDFSPKGSHHFYYDKETGKLKVPSMFGIPVDPRRPRDFTLAIQGVLNKIGVSTDIGVHHNLAGYNNLVDAIRELQKTDYIHDEKGMQQMRYLRDLLYKLLNNYNNAIEQKKNEWSQSAKEETEDLDFIKKHMPISDVFNANVQIALLAMSFGDPRTLMFAMPQLLGSSNASLILSLGSMAVKLAAAYVNSPLAIGSGLVVGSQMDISNAAWENNAEVAEGYRRKIERALNNSGLYNDVLNELKQKIDGSENMKPEDLFRRLYNGEVELDNIKANEIIADAVYGADIAFQYDMGETARSAYKESMLQLLPVGPIAKAVKYGLKKGVYETANGISKLLGKGEINVEKAVRATGVAAENATAFNRSAAEASEFINTLPRTLLMDAGSVFKTASQFGVKTSLNMVSEGVEEGVQHVTQNRYVSNEYGESINQGLFKPIVEDMILGTRLGWEWLTGNDAGSGYISDSQMFSEMRGGALGALFQATPVHVASSVNSLRSELAASLLVSELAYNEKLSQRDKIEKLKSYIKSIARDKVRYDDVMRKFDRFITINENLAESARILGTENKGIAREFIEEARELYKKAVSQVANDNLTNIYKSHGIKKGSDEYNLDLAIVIDLIDRLKESKDALDENKALGESRLVAEQMNQSTQYLDDMSDEATIDLANSLVIERKARLLAALEVAQQYDTASRLLEGLSKFITVLPRKSTIQRRAEMLIRRYNKELGVDIKTVDEFIDKFGVIDEELKDIYRQEMVLQSEYDVAKATVSRLLTPVTAVNTVKKLSKQYDQSKKDDEQLQLRIHDDYVKYIDRQKKIHDYVIDEHNNTYLGRDGKEYIVERINDQYVKRLYDRDTNEGYGSPMAFNKEEYYEYREIADATEKTPIDIPSVRETYEASADTETHRKMSEGMDYEAASEYTEADEFVYRQMPVSSEQADQLISAFFDRFASDDSKWETRGSIKRKARGVIKYMLTHRKDKFGRNMALKISMLHNNGYTFKQIGDRYYAVKGAGVAEARVALTRHEALFGLFLQEEYGTDPIIRIDSTENVLDNTNLNMPSAPTPPPEPEKEYEPNSLQQLIRDVLKNKANTDKATLVARNGNNYFFRADNGKVVMYTRLHAEIGSQKKESPLSKEKKEEVMSKIVELWSDKDALKKYIESLLENEEKTGWNDLLKTQYSESSTTYKKNKIDLSVYTTPEMLQNQNIIEAIGNLVSGLRDDHVEIIDGPWAKAGNIIDEIYRRIINGDLVSYAGSLDLENEEVLLSEVMSAEIFDNIISLAKQFKDWLSENHLVPVTDRVLLHAQLPNGHYVAGETDLICIDESGNLVLFDFKTSQFEFDEGYKKVYNGYRWSTETQHSRQLTGYENLILSEFENRYNVTHMYIVPIVHSYSSEMGVFDKFISVERKPLIELSINEDLNNQLNREHKTIDELKDYINLIESHINSWGESIAQYYDKLSPYTLQTLRNIRTTLNKINDRTNRLDNNSPSVDIDNIENDAVALEAEFDRITGIVDEQIQRMIDAGVEANIHHIDTRSGSPLGRSRFDEDPEFENIANGEREFNPEEDDYDWAGGLEEEPDLRDRQRAQLDDLLENGPGRRRQKQTFGRSLDDIAEDMQRSGLRGGRVLGDLPEEEPQGQPPTVSGAYGAAPIVTGSKSISDAPDYSNQPPIEFTAETKPRTGGYVFYNNAHRGDIKGQLAKDACDPDFSEKAIFKLNMGKISVGLTGDFLSTKIKWGGKTYSVSFYWATAARDELADDGSTITINIAEKVKNKIRALQAAYPGALLIISKISRTNGKFKFGKDQKNLIDSPFLTDDNELLTLLDSGIIGISDNGYILPVSRSSSARPLYAYTSGIDVTPGFVTLLYDRHYAEDKGGPTKYVPIPLTHKRLTENDIDLIIDILRNSRGKQLKDTYRNIKVGNREVQSPVSDWYILNTLIRFGDITRLTNMGDNFIFDFVRDDEGKEDRTRIEISGIGSDRGTLYEVDLTNDEQVLKLKDRLKVSGFVYANNKNMLMHNLDGSVDNVESNPFKRVSAFFKSDENKNINQIKISDSLVFDKKDVDFNEDGTYIALNGVGWMIRHGWVTTNIEGFENPRISAEDVDVDEIDREAIQEELGAAESTPELKAEELIELQQPEQFSSDEALKQQTIEDLAQDQQNMSMYNDIPFKTQTHVSNNPIDTEKARKRIRRMLGKRFQVNIVDGVLKVFEQGKAWAVGACKKDSIVLSRLADAGTEFHESFHRVMELLFSPKHRQKLHEHYIKRYNNGVDMSEKETGEHLADMFMNFINNLPNVYLSWNILKTFNLVRDWINAWRNIDDKTLALTFFYAYSGLARFASVSKESSDNFDRIWGDAAYFTTELKGNQVTFKEFVNGVHLKDGIKFATKLILTGYKIDSLGTNLKNLDIRMDTIKKASWYKTAVGEGVDQKSSLLRQLSEIFDHYGTTQKLIVDELERLSIGGKIDRDEQKQTDKQGPDVSIIFQDVDGHMDEFYRYDRKLDLDTSLKIFLSTIPHFRYSTRLDLKWETNKNGQFIDKNGNPIVDENGNPTTDTSKRVRRTKKLDDGTVVPVGTVDELFIITNNGQKIRTQVEVSTNSLGVSEFMDFETVYALLVSKLQSSENVADMINRLRVLSKDDPMFRYIYANMWMWNNQSVIRYPDTQKEVVMIGDMKLDLNDYTFRIDQYTGDRLIVYAHDAEGHRAGDVIQDAYILTNVDKESLVTRMFLSFKSQRLKFIFVFENAEKDSYGNVTGRFSYENKETNSTSSSRIYPRQWFDNLRYGLTDVFEIIGDSIRIKPGMEKIFGNIAKELRLLQQNMFNESTNGIFTLNYNGEEYTLNKYAAEDLDFIEEYFVSRLNILGIDISKPVLDYYLNTTYPDIENKTDRFILMLSAKSRTSSFGSFLKMIDNLDLIVSKGEYTKILVDNKVPATRMSKAVREGLYIFAENAFVKEMGTAYGNYRLATNEFMTLGPENTKMYTMAQNHTGSEFTDDFNKAIVDENGNVSGSETLTDMMKFCYNYMKVGGKSIGSVIIKHLLTPNHRALDLGTFIGTKRDDTHDGGVKYTKISKREDWISKAVILSNGGIIFPTLSDKSTWFYLTGVLLPGLQYDELDVYGTLPRWRPDNGRIVFGTNDTVGSYEDNDVLEQFREYAHCEREAVVKAINELKTLKENEKSEKNPGKKLELLDLIKNFHTNNQAARFAFLLGVYYEDPNDPNYYYKGKGERFVSFNFTKKYNLESGKYEDADLEDCLKLADKYFFTKSRGELRSMIANILQHRLDDELEWAVEYGIIEKKQLFLGRAYTEYRNKLLDHRKIDALVEKYRNTKLNDGTTYGLNLSIGALESMAVVAYIMDINNKSIMSTEEVMRLYTGIPHFFKWKYGDDGILTDMHGDLVKRLGGLGSTGDTNRRDLPNIARDYTVAEIKDEEIKSEIFEAYKEGFLDNEYRITVYQLEIDKLRLSTLPKEQRKEVRKRIWDEIMEKDLEEVKKMADTRTRRIVEANAAAETKSFESGINVADGTAFISPQMTLNLLRERGAFTQEVKKAFDYLMGLDAGSTQLSNHHAYKTITEALISTLKYSAFGYRMLNDVPVHYYNKFALFPIFKSMAYGFTKDMYDKMIEDGVDMLMFESAVKVGSQGAVKFTRDTFRQNDDDEDDVNWEHNEEGDRTTLKPNIKDFHFNTYKLQYKFIRRQLNTDPREDERMHIGTQMLKITLLNLFKEAIYHTERGPLSGTELRDDIMECMNELARRGLDKLKDQLFTNNKPDVVKMSKFLKEELGKRNADKNTLRALDIIEEEDGLGNKHARFRTPLEAMSNLAWIESIIISHINREVIDINLPGNAFYQRTPFGIEGSPIRALKEDMLDNVEDKSKVAQIIEKAKKLFLIYSGRSLKAINNEGSMDCLISIDYFLNQKGLIPEEYRGDYWAVRRFLKKNNIIGKNAKAIMVGYRIPTQAESSVHALRVVDVLPVVRDTIILPKDFTKITGSDFDIDKLYLTSFNFSRNEDGTVTTQFEESDDRHWLNRLLDNYLTLLKDGGRVEEDENGKLVYHKGRTLQFLHRSIDNDTKLVKGDPNAVYERIIGNRDSKPELPFGYQSLHTQVDIKTLFIGGKFGIGPYALANNALILTMLYDVEFKDIPGGIMSELGANSLHNRTDKNGNSILAWLSAMINMHVDVAKDPAITELNVNSYTYGISNLLLRTGMGDLTFMFLCQPIMREAASAYELAAGNLVDDPGKSKTMRQEQAVQDRMHALLDNLGPDYKELLSTILSQGRIGDADDLRQASAKIVQVAKQLFGVENGLYINGFYRWNPSKEAPYDTLTSGKSILEDVLTNPDILIDPEKPVTMNNLKDIPYYAIKIDGEWESFTPKEVLLFVIGAMYEFRPYTNALENVVKYTKIDTKKQGNSWSEYMDYIDNYESLFSGDESSSMFTDEINDMLEKSFIHTKTEMFTKDEYGDDVNFLTLLLKNSAIQYTDGFRLVVKIIQELIKNHTDAARSKINRIILGYIKAQFFNDYMQKNNIDPKGLFVGPNAIANRVTRIKHLIRRDTTGKYTDYASNSVITNGFLAALETVPYEHNARQPLFVKLNKAMLDDPDMIDDIIDGWAYMLNDKDNDDIRQLARDLVVYSFLTSADTNGFTKFFKFVPIEWKEESGYNNYMKNLLNMTDEDFVATYGNADVIDNMIINNWFDSTIVPVTLYTEVNSNNGLRFIGKPVRTNDAVLKKSLIMSIIGAIWHKPGGPWRVSLNAKNAQRFIKIRRRKAMFNEEDQYLLYKLIGFGRKTVNKESIDYPIYALIKPNGMSVDTKTGNYFNIYEYNNPFGFVTSIDSVVNTEDDVESLMNQVDVIKDWMQRTPGGIIQEHPAYSKLAELLGADFRDISVDMAYGNQLSSSTEVLTDELGVIKIISGALTGVDTIGLEVGRNLGIQTGGTTTPGFVREKNIDSYTREQLEQFGVTEISADLQAGKSGREFYLPRTEQNVLNSDGTVYFASDEDSAGKIATERFANKHNKPFLLNPTADLLTKWIIDNNIRILNVAGNRGSKLGNMRDSVVETLTEGIKNSKLSEEEREGKRIKDICNGRR